MRQNFLKNHVVRLFLLLLSILLYNLWRLCNLIIIIEIRWKRKGYLMILNEFVSNLSPSLKREWL